MYLTRVLKSLDDIRLMNTTNYGLIFTFGMTVLVILAGLYAMGVTTNLPTHSMTWFEPKPEVYAPPIPSPQQHALPPKPICVSGTMKGGFCVLK
jgi:hypothetical protein